MGTNFHYQQVGLHKNKLSTQQRTQSAGLTDSPKNGWHLYQPRFRQGLISKIYTEFQKLTTTGIKQLPNKLTNELNRKFQSNKYEKSITIFKRAQYPWPSRKYRLNLLRSHLTKVRIERLSSTNLTKIL